MRVPPPVPRAVGCYVLDGSTSTWNPTACPSTQALAALAHPLIGGASGIYGISAPCTGSCGAKVGSLITAASVAVTFPSCGTPPCTELSPIYGVNDTGTGRNSFSLQLNTNSFSMSCHPGSAPPGQDMCVVGDSGMVQFTYQADTGWANLFGGATLCVWNVDNTAQNYKNWCVGLPSPFGNNVVWNAAPGQLPFQITGGASGGTLWIMSCVPWASNAPMQCWSAVAPDLLGLCWNPSSGQCSWEGVSGSILGWGNSSTVQFPSGTVMNTGVAAASCIPSSAPPALMGFAFMPSSLAALQCPTDTGPPYSNGYSVNDNNMGGPVTLETSNLTPRFSPATSVIPGCFNGTCWMSYCSSDSNSCPSGP